VTAEDAEAAIRQMVASFPSPTHLRNNPEGYRYALDVYRSALSRFDRETLQKGWLKAAAENDVWCWPKCSAIVTACESFRPRIDRLDAWAEEASEMADSYTRRFLQTSKYAVRAREGGYEAELKRYVREASWVQAQLIGGREGIAYRSPVLFPHCENDKEAQEAFFQRCREQGDAGQIKVTVPPALLRTWQRERGPTGPAR
jgi:hypothetical protein